MQRSEKSIRPFLLDTNVFIAAIKDPRKETKSLQLILKMLEDEAIRMVGDEFLVEEMLRYADEFDSETAALVLLKLINKIELIEPGENFIKICRSYIRTPNLADIVHAAVCLRTGAVLITNDTHFNRIRDEGIIEVWSIGDALKAFLK